MAISGPARFLIAMLVSLLLTTTVVGAVVGGIIYAVTRGAVYVVTRGVVSPRRDIFRAAAFEFELAPGWWCELDGTEYVCSPPGKPPYSAIAVIAMKGRNEQDNLKAYEEHLRQPQKSGDSGKDEGKFSEIRYVRRSVIASQEWVEALHAGSELPNFDTYYLATNTSYLGILVTMSVHKDQSKQYIAQLNPRGLKPSLNLALRGGGHRRCGRRLVGIVGFDMG